MFNIFKKNYVMANIKLDGWVKKATANTKPGHQHSAAEQYSKILTFTSNSYFKHFLNIMSYRTKILSMYKYISGWDLVVVGERWQWGRPRCMKKLSSMRGDDEHIRRKVVSCFSSFVFIIEAKWTWM